MGKKKGKKDLEKFVDQLKQSFTDGPPQQHQHAQHQSPHVHLPPDASVSAMSAAQIQMNNQRILSAIDQLMREMDSIKRSLRSLLIQNGIDCMEASHFFNG